MVQQSGPGCPVGRISFRMRNAEEALRYMGFTHARNAPFACIGVVAAVGISPPRKTTGDPQPRPPATPPSAPDRQRSATASDASPTPSTTSPGPPTPSAQRSTPTCSTPKIRTLHRPSRQVDLPALPSDNRMPHLRPQQQRTPRNLGRQSTPRTTTKGRMTSMDICFLDTETLGLHPDAPVWEFRGHPPQTRWIRRRLSLLHRPRRIRARQRPNGAVDRRSARQFR